VEIPATSDNIPGTLVLRDISGNFSAGAVTGNSSTATALQTGRTIELTGDVTGSALFDGTANAFITASISSGVIVDADINSTAGIASTKLSVSTQKSLVPAGAVMAFAMNSAPSGWLAADGSNVSRSTYADLFSAIGTTHGAGDGSTTFTLPDLRGYFVRGSGTNSDATASGTFGAKQAAAMLNHTHSGTTQINSVGHTHGQQGTFSLSSQAVLAGGVGANITTGGGGYGPVLTPTVTISGNTGTQSANHTHTFTSGNPSAGGGTETRPANIALLYCIKH
jgi:microcystin-dependent protein